MPSGAKKRRAARRKEMGIHPPDSPTNPSGNCESPSSKGETSDEGEKKCESPRSESIAVAAMDSSEKGKEKPSEESSKVTENPPKEEKVVEEETVPIPVTREADDVCVELVQPVKEESGGGGEGPTEVAEEKSATVASVVPVDEPVYVTEEVVEATEAATATSEALAGESEVKPVPVSEIPPASATEQARPPESGEVCQESERSEVVPVSLVDHRATWWNCCGLFDVFTSSKDATSLSAFSTDDVQCHVLSIFGTVACIEMERCMSVHSPRRRIEQLEDASRAIHEYLYIKARRRFLGG